MAQRFALRSLTLIVLSAAVWAQTFNLLSYGGNGDGVADNTAAFTKAVAAVAAAGGGTLIVPSGAFKTMAFNLTSSMTLLLDDGATVQSSLNYPDWPRIAPLRSYPGDGPRYSPLIGGYGLHDVRILGNASAASRPVIDGMGLAWDVAYFAKILQAQRPHTIELANSTGIEIAHVSIEEAAYWTVHFSECVGVHLHDAAILAATENGDGCDIGAQDVLLERMHIATADDAIAIKSGDAPAGSGLPPSRNITIRDSTLASGEGCIAIGSEMTAGVEDVAVYNITCEAAGHALLYIKERRLSGGYVRNVTVSDSSITGPVERFLWLSQHFGESGENSQLGVALPVLANITRRNIVVSGEGGVVQAALLNGTGPAGAGGAGGISGLVLENVELSKPLLGWTCVNATGVWRNVSPAPCQQLTPE